jgi:hypothetical protein
MTRIHVAFAHSARHQRYTTLSTRVSVNPCGAK